MIQKQYRADGFFIAPEPVIPADIINRDCMTFHGSGPNLSNGPRRSFAIHMRTEKSRPVHDKREGLSRYIDDPTRCPVIYNIKSQTNEL